MRERPGRAIPQQPTMVESFLEFSSGGLALMRE
jgi:hypothetical protein